MPEHDIICVEPLTVNLSWEADRLQSIALRWSEAGDVSTIRTKWAKPFQESLQRYLDKQEPDWPEFTLADTGMSDFTLRILQRLRMVPFGAWSSYGRLAAESGHPGAARAVGRVMAGNPWPLLFPCHRVLGKKGQLTGFGPGLDLKRYLLAIEGISCSSSSRCSA
ncbi:methylated-DNA--[protein]-cysteine S-methyltransferase [Desulfonatronum thioautotrophicum]|uniref:methylated-DNA--[protein]-cysteine S-methyltransferase n=1 Tax=Desulfonatronum thioautotrophicum TaxID=617001 RepID=UPI0005EB79FF|nr:MGMT family protein [Desulfonatronum thioautotrophicum]